MVLDIFTACDPDLDTADTKNCLGPWLADVKTNGSPAFVKKGKQYGKEAKEDRMDRNKGIEKYESYHDQAVDLCRLLSGVVPFNPIPRPMLQIQPESRCLRSSEGAHC